MLPYCPLCRGILIICIPTKITNLLNFEFKIFFSAALFQLSSAKPQPNYVYTSLGVQQCVSFAQLQLSLSPTMFISRLEFNNASALLEFDLNDFMSP